MVRYIHGPHSFFCSAWPLPGFLQKSACCKFSVDCFQHHMISRKLWSCTAWGLISLVPSRSVIAPGNEATCMGLRGPDVENIGRVVHGWLGARSSILWYQETRCTWLSG